MEDFFFTLKFLGISLRDSAITSKDRQTSPHLPSSLTFIDWSPLSVGHGEYNTLSFKLLEYFQAITGKELAK